MTLRVLSDADVASVLSLPALLPVVADAFTSQGAETVERPDRPHFPVGIDPEDSDGTAAGVGLTMPAYIHGAETVATKLVGVHEDNPDRGLPTVNAQVVLTDAETGQPRAYLHGNRITNARTACIGGLAVRELVPAPVTLGVVGAGAQARWQTRAVAAATGLEAVRVYSPSDSRVECAADLDAELDAPVQAVDTARAAVADATAVVTTTTATEPTFPADALGTGALVVAVGAYNAELQEVPPAVFERADKVFADVPAEVVETGDLRATTLAAGDLVPFAGVCAGAAGREHADELLVVASVGSAVLDAAAAAHVFERAVEADVGTTVDLSEQG